MDGQEATDASGGLLRQQDLVPGEKSHAALRFRVFSLTRRQAYLGLVRVRLVLVAILLLGAALRLFRLADVPEPEAFADELNLYVSMHSIVTTGHDVDGALHPFLYCAMTRNPPMYAIVGYLSTLVFGNNTFGLRFPAVIFGVMTIAAFYFLSFELTKRRDIALTSAFLCAVQPLYIHFSRVGWEPASELPFLLAGLYALLRALRPENERVPFELLAVSGFFLAGSTYTYQGAWLYAALLAASAIALNGSRFRMPEEREKLLGAAALCAAVAAPALYMMFTDPHTYWRATWMGTFKDGVTHAAIQTFITHYFMQFSPSFLFTTGSAEPKYLRGAGIFFWWIAPLVVVGATKYGEKYMQAGWMTWWLRFWLLIYPLGAALTNDGSLPHAPRTLAGTPVFCFFAAVGFAALCDLQKTFRPVAGFDVRTFSTLCVASSLIPFCLFYFTVYPRMYDVAWDSGTRDTFTVVRAYAPRYARVCFGGFHPWRIGTLIRYYINDLPLEKIENTDDPACFQSGTLLVTAGVSTQRMGFSQIASVNRIDGTPYSVIEGR